MGSPASARTAAFFDLDKTVIARSSALAFSRPFYQAGLLTRRGALKAAYTQFLFSVGGADAEQIERMRRHLSSMCAGWDVAQVRDIVAEALVDTVDPIVYDEAATLMEGHHAAGRDVVIVSASGAEVVEPIGELLGADRVIATRLVVHEGHYTGEIDYYAYGEAKAEAVRALADVQGYDLAESFAYSDSLTDLPMLAAVGHAYVVNPDRALRREALARGWPVLVFTRPVPLRARVGGALPDHSLAAAAIGAGAATAGLVWYATRRRGR